MVLGVCGGPSVAAVAAKSGFSYFEWSVQAFLQPRAGRDAFLKNLEQVRAAALPCPVLNCFLPGDLKVVGPAVDTADVEAYVATACERAAEAGVDTIVFGSGGARQVPDGFARERAEDQLRGFLRLVAPHAARNGVTVVVEPLRRQECNIFNTVAECAGFVREVNQPSIRLLADGYHWAGNGESEADLAAHADLLRHLHLATQAHRRAPGAEPCEALPRFLAAVRRAGYTGRLSIEGRIENPEQELPVAAALMRAP